MIDNLPSEGVIDVHMFTAGGGYYTDNHIFIVFSVLPGAVLVLLMYIFSNIKKNIQINSELIPVIYYSIRYIM